MHQHALMRRSALLNLSTRCRHCSLKRRGELPARFSLLKQFLLDPTLESVVVESWFEEPMSYFVQSFEGLKLLGCFVAGLP